MSNIEQNICTIDAMGQPCPMPLLLLKRALKTKTNQHVLLKSSDPHSQIDITRYCEIHHLNCVLKQINDQEFHYIIES